MKDKMRIWDQVCKTDPKYTKKVNQRGGFTAIDAQYQLMMATEMFGPIGYGWGVKDETFNIIGEMVIYQGILFYHYGIDGDSVGVNEIPIHSSLQVKPDCIKSVATDALTKGLSKLGFNADVFLGRFDDNQYVQNVKKEFNKKSNSTITHNDGGQFDKTQKKPNQDLVEALEKDEPLLNGVVDQAKQKMTNGNAGTIKDAVCNFKKHKGKMWSQVAVEDINYIEWVVGNMDLNSDTEEILNQFV
jgi:hypothetical protein